MPGHRPDRFDTARAAGADGGILDLEDAVPAADKASLAIAQAPAVQRLVLNSRLAGLAAPVDGVSTVLDGWIGR